MEGFFIYLAFAMNPAAEIVFKYFPGITDDQRKKILLLEKIYGSLNEKVNLISRNDMDNLYERHVLHSLAIAKFINFKSGAHVLDAGTGGGFPGIPLAILFPEARFMLVDSTGKKINAVNEVKDELQLENVKTVNCRIEEMKGSFDFIATRALAEIKQVLKWTKNNCKARRGSGYIFLKGGDVHAEMKQSGRKDFKVISVSQYFSEPFFETKKLIWLPFLPE